VREGQNAIDGMWIVEWIEDLRAESCDESVEFKTRVKGESATSALASTAMHRGWFWVSRSIHGAADSLR